MSDYVFCLFYFLQSLQENSLNEFKVSKLNIKFGADTARKYNVMSSPTIVFFKDGEEVNRIKGVAKKADLEAIIKEIV